MGIATLRGLGVSENQGCLKAVWIGRSEGPTPQSSDQRPLRALVSTRNPNPESGTRNPNPEPDPGTRNPEPKPKPETRTLNPEPGYESLNPTPETRCIKKNESETRRTRPLRCRADVAHIRQSGPDSGLGFKVKVLSKFQVVASSLGSGEYPRPRLWSRNPDPNLRFRNFEHENRI
jgi:hypothetical protein